MAGKGTHLSKRALAQKRGNFTVTCPNTKEEEEDSSAYTLEVPSLSTTLNYKGQTIDVSLNQFDTIRVLGRGNFGYVLEVTIKGHPDVQMAVKKIGLESQEERRASTYTDLTTIQNVGSQNFPYIISYYGAVIDREAGELLICVELMDASLEKFYQALHSFGNITFNDFNPILCRLTHNITSALNFLKTHRILHRDVKPQNMLVNSQSIFKLCDFGICRRMRMSQSIAIGSVQGVEAYLPPELNGGTSQTYGIRADMWALGISLFEIVVGQHPFANMSSFQILTNIRSWNPVVPSNSEISDDMKRLILHLLKRNVEERPKTYLEILDIPSIQAVNQNPPDEEKHFVARILGRISQN